MRVCQIFAVGPIMHHEEPPANLLPGCMQGVACECLLNLCQQQLGIGDEDIANVGIVLEFPSQNVDRDTEQVARQLPTTAIERRKPVHGSTEAKSTFAPN